MHLVVEQRVAVVVVVVVAEAFAVVGYQADDGALPLPALLEPVEHSADRGVGLGDLGVVVVVHELPIDLLQLRRRGWAFVGEPAPSRTRVEDLERHLRSGRRQLVAKRPLYAASVKPSRLESSVSYGRCGSMMCQNNSHGVVRCSSTNAATASVSRPTDSIAHSDW